jgi:two-component system, LuxR family, sensor kinase FixL
MSVHSAEMFRPLVGVAVERSAAPITPLATSAAMRVGLMHELGQPLSALATYIHACRHLLKTENVDRQLVAETMMKAEKEVKRARDVLSRLREFVASEKGNRLPVNLPDLIKNVANCLRNEAKTRAVRLQIEAGSVPVVIVDLPQIRQVIVNLLSNAIDAAANMPNGTVRIRCCHESGTIAIAVEDNGKGVAPEIAEYVFEPFQTTKSRGMGLGLPLSRKIIEAHGGRIWWERAVPQGTRFHVHLPIKRPDQYAA